MEPVGNLLAEETSGSDRRASILFGRLLVETCNLCLQ